MDVAVSTTLRHCGLPINLYRNFATAWFITQSYFNFSSLSQPVGHYEPGVCAGFNDSPSTRISTFSL